MRASIRPGAGQLGVDRLRGGNVKGVPALARELAASVISDGLTAPAWREAVSDPQAVDAVAMDGANAAVRPTADLLSLQRPCV
jgi:hypothetical protein